MKIQSMFTACAASLVAVLGAHNAHATCFGETQVQSWMSGELILLDGAPGSPDPGWDLQSKDAGNGFMQQFTTGQIWADACESSIVGGWVHGDILTHYNSLGDAGGIMGFPTSSEEETPSGDGRMNTFEAFATGGSTGGAIYWSSATGAFEMHGNLYTKYLVYGSTGSGLGYPTSDVETCTSCTGGSGNMNTMQNGFMADVSGHAWALFTVPYESPKLFAQRDPSCEFEPCAVTLFGSGFAANEPVTINRLMFNGRTMWTTATADSGGNFTKGVGEFDDTSGIPGTGAWSDHTILTWEAVGNTSGPWLASVPL